MSAPDSLVQIARYGYSKVYRDDDNHTVLWTGKMDINADGSPHAYHPVGSPGLDFLPNAGHPGNWWGIACDVHGQPFVQGPNDPAPGYYVSTTAGLADSSLPESNPNRYLNSEKVNFIVIPRRFPVHVSMFTPVTVTNTENGVTADAIVGDVGPSDVIGEGSIALAIALGVNSNPRNGGVSGGISYVIHLPS